MRISKEIISKIIDYYEEYIEAFDNPNNISAEQYVSNKLSWDEPHVPSFNECAKMWDICDSYHCQSHPIGWEWNEAVNYIQEHWNDTEFNIDYKTDLALENK